MEPIQINEPFEPKDCRFPVQLVFLCRSRQRRHLHGCKSPANILPIRVMCSGRVSPEMILRAFRSGADGVMVLGCHIGDCHYINANHRTVKAHAPAAKSPGLYRHQPRPPALDWVSSAEAPKFAKVTTEFVETITELGPIA